MRQLTAYAKAIERGERPDLPQITGSELKLMRDAYEKMIQSLEERDNVEHYVQTLTHELKSPLSAIRGAAELLREEMPDAQRNRFLNNIQVESNRLHALLDQLLLLVSLEHLSSLEECVEVDFSAIVREACESIQLSGVGKDVQIHELISPAISVRGDSVLLRMMVSNLLQNAMDFSPVGGVIEVKLKRVSMDLEFSITDEGNGIPEYALRRLFERFYSLPRPQSGRKSSGLGLCFVREAALLHGATIEVNNRVERSGVVAVIRMTGDST